MASNELVQNSSASSWQARVRSARRSQALSVDLLTNEQLVTKKFYLSRKIELYSLAQIVLFSFLVVCPLIAYWAFKVAINRCAIYALVIMLPTVAFWRIARRLERRHHEVYYQLQKLQ